MLLHMDTVQALLSRFLSRVWHVAWACVCACFELHCLPGALLAEQRRALTE